MCKGHQLHTRCGKGGQAGAFSCCPANRQYSKPFQYSSAVRVRPIYSILQFVFGREPRLTRFGSIETFQVFFCSSYQTDPLSFAVRLRTSRTGVDEIWWQERLPFARALRPGTVADPLGQRIPGDARLLPVNASSERDPASWIDSFVATFIRGTQEARKSRGGMMHGRCRITETSSGCMWQARHAC